MIPQQGGNIHEAETVAQEYQGSSSAACEAAPAVEHLAVTEQPSSPSLAVTDATIASSSAANQSDASPTLQSALDANLSSSGETAAEGPLELPVATAMPPSSQHVEDHPASDLERSHDDFQPVNDHSTATLSADFEVLTPLSLFNLQQRTFRHANVTKCAGVRRR